MTATHKAGMGRDWTEGEIALLWRWARLRRGYKPPVALLAHTLKRTPQAIRVKLTRLRKRRRAG